MKLIDFGKVRWTLVAVIFLSLCVQWISCRVLYTQVGSRGQTYDLEGDNDDGRDDNEIVDYNHKHLERLKAPNPKKVEIVKKRIKARQKGRKPDQSNERNLWTSHPKNEDWSGPDTHEVYDVFPSLGI